MLAAFAWALGCCSLLAAACVWRGSKDEPPTEPTAPTASTAPASTVSPLGLSPGREHRELFDVNFFDGEEAGTPYSIDPEEAAAIKVTCAIDAVQAAAYLGEAVVAIYRLEICPDDEPLGCTAPLAHSITDIIWVMAFITSATSTCAETINFGTSCAAAVLRDLATAGSTIYGFDEDCFLTKPLVDNRVFQPPRPRFVLPEDHRRLRQASTAQETASELHRNIALYRNKSAELQRRLKDISSKIPDHQHQALPNVLFDATTHGLPRGALDGTYAKIRAVKRHNNRKTERNFALSACAFDSTSAVGWLMRALMSIKEAATGCDNPKFCVVDVTYVLGSLSYAAMMLSTAFVDCPTYGNWVAVKGFKLSY